MQLGHVFTLTNRSMKKPLLTAASVALSLAAFLGSGLAVAQTNGPTTVDGVWNSDNGRFEFYDSRLNDSDYFASLSLINGFRLDTGFRLEANMSSRSNGEKYYYEYRDHYLFPYGDEEGGRTYQYYSMQYSLTGYSGGVLSQEKHITRSDGETCRNYAGNCYLWYDRSYYERSSGGSYSSSDPIFVNSELSSAISAIPYPGAGIFNFVNFEQSFIHYSDGDSQSLAEIISQIMLEIPRNPEQIRSSGWGYGVLSVDTRNNSFIFYRRSCNEYEDCYFPFASYDDIPSITGITLALIPSAIPEPETWAMLLAGLGVVGAVTRRRRIKAAM